MEIVTLLEELNTRASIYSGSSTNRVVTMRQKPFPGLQYVRMTTAHDISFRMVSVQTKLQNSHPISTKLHPTQYLSPSRGLLKACPIFQPEMTKYP